MAKNFNVAPFHHQDSELPASPSVPEKHFSQWLQKQFHLAKLKVWIGFAEFSIAVIAAGVVITIVAIKAPNALTSTLALVGAIGSATGITAGVRKYLKRSASKQTIN